MKCSDERKKHVLVTGGAGFIGSHVTQQLLKENWRVTVLDNLSTGFKEHIPSEAFFHLQDVCDVEALEALFKTEAFDAVVHLAAQTMVNVSLEQPGFDCELNLTGTVGLLELCRKYQVKKVIFASTAAVYGDNSELPLGEEEEAAPLSFYGLSKHSVERYLALFHRIYGLEYTALRFANVYGERQGDGGEGGVVSIFTRLMHQKTALHVYGSGLQTRDFIYAGDVAAAIAAALPLSVPSGVYNVSTGRQTSVADLIECLSRIAKVVPAVITKPARGGDILHSALDPSRFQQATGWKANMPLQEGLKRTYQALANF